MTYTMHYDSPLGGILLAADEEGLTGLWFETQKYFAAKLAPEHEEKMTPALDAACRWLTARPRPTARWRDSWPSKAESASRHRRWAALWGTTPSPSSCPATGWWAAAAA